MTESQLRILAVSPSMSRLLGHDYEYHQSLHDGFAKIGVDYKVLIPTKTEFTPPAHCVPCLIHFKAGETTFRKVWTRFANFFLSFIILSKQFTKEAIPASATVQTVLFIESFKSLELLAFLLSSVLFGKGASVAVLLRNRPALYRFKGRPLIFFLKFLLKIKGHRHVKILCDGTPIQKSFEAKLPIPIHVLPIPHTFMGQKNTGTSSSVLKCWWAGNPNRHKGLKIIQKLVASPAKRKIILALSQATPLAEETEESGATNLILEKLPEVLSREEYVRQMLATDFLLLPYDPFQYRSGTSGVFVEGVISGAIPLVTEGTWMAEELKEHHLPELISAFDIQDLSEQIYPIAERKDVRERLNSMRKIYRKFHNPDSFAQLFKSIVVN